MIQMTDIGLLSALQSSFTRSVSAHSENWNDEVFARLQSEYVLPVQSQMSMIISEAGSSIRQICAIYNEMEQIASNY